MTDQNEPQKDPPWLAVAQKDAADHVAEVPGPKANARIIQMDSYTTLKATSDEIAWCSAAMCAWMEESGIKSTRSAMARSWLEWGVKLDEPRRGCVTVMRRGEPPQGHVFLFIRQEGQRVYGLGGNQGDCVCYRWFNAADVLGYRWPAGM